MKPILIFCKTLAIGGAEKQALTLAKLLSEKGENVLVINWCGDIIDARNSTFIRENSIRYIGLEGNAISKYIKFIKIIKNEKIAVILSYLTLANFISGVSKLFLNDIVSIGGVRTEKLPFYKFFFEKLAHNYLNDATVFNNYSAKSKFEKRGFNPGKIYVIHNTIRPYPVYVNENPANEIVIVSVSRFVEPKDFETALYSFKQVVEKNPGKKLKYRIVGYGPLEGRIRSLISLLDLQKEVDILINPPSISDILKSCDIYLSTSLFEGLSNSVMEAMSSGLPAIATDVGDNRYLIEDGYNGYIVPCRDVGLIVEKLDYLIHFEMVRKEFGNNSWLKIGSEFSEKELVEHYYELFSGLRIN